MVQFKIIIDRISLSAFPFFSSALLDVPSQPRLRPLSQVSNKSYISSKEKK